MSSILGRPLLFVMLGLACACQAPAQLASPAGMVQHVVICWLKEPGDAGARRRLIDLAKSLSAIPGVTAVKAGEVLPSGRSVADDSFDVAIVISFRDLSSLQAYLEHPKHEQALRNTIRPLVSRLVVYDFVE